MTVPEAIEPAMVAQLCIPIVGCSALDLVCALPSVQGGAYNWASATTATLTCSQGYTASSPFGGTITCTNNQWSQQTVTCNLGGVGRRLQEQSKPEKAAEELKLLVEPALAE